MQSFTSVYYRLKQNTVVVYCTETSWILQFGSEYQLEDMTPHLAETGEVSQKLTSKQGRKCVGDKHVTIFSITPMVRCSIPLIKSFQVSLATIMIHGAWLVFKTALKLNSTRHKSAILQWNFPLCWQGSQTSGQVHKVLFQSNRRSSYGHLIQEVIDRFIC